MNDNDDNVEAEASASEVIPGREVEVLDLEDDEGPPVAEGDDAGLDQVVPGTMELLALHQALANHGVSLGLVSRIEASETPDHTTVWTSDGEAHEVPLPFEDVSYLWGSTVSTVDDIIRTCTEEADEDVETPTLRRAVSPVLVHPRGVLLLDQVSAVLRERGPHGCQVVVGGAAVSSRIPYDVVIEAWSTWRRAEPVRRVLEQQRASRDFLGFLASLGIDTDFLTRAAASTQDDAVVPVADDDGEEPLSDKEMLRRKANAMRFEVACHHARIHPAELAGSRVLPVGNVQGLLEDFRKVEELLDVSLDQAHHAYLWCGPDFDPLRHTRELAGGWSESLAAHEITPDQVVAISTLPCGHGRVNLAGAHVDLAIPWALLVAFTDAWRLVARLGLEPLTCSTVSDDDGVETCPRLPQSRVARDGSMGVTEAMIDASRFERLCVSLQVAPRSVFDLGGAEGGPQLLVLSPDRATIETTATKDDLDQMFGGFWAHAVKDDPLHWTRVLAATFEYWVRTFVGQEGDVRSVEVTPDEAGWATVVVGGESHVSHAPYDLAVGMQEAFTWLQRAQVQPLDEAPLHDDAAPDHLAAAPSEE